MYIVREDMNDNLYVKESSVRSTTETDVSATEKALRILDCFSVLQPELSLAQISQMLRFPKSTTLNQIRTLEHAGFLYRVKNSHNYRLGFKLLELNYTAHSTMAIVQYAMPLMEMLQAESKENIYLTTHLNGRVLYLECLHSSKHTIAYSVAGKTLPMHCTGCGKIMLSYMPQEKVQQILSAHGMPPITPNTITDYELFMDELKTSRERGYAIDNEEESVGGKCVAVAVRTAKGDVAGALSISGSIMSMTEENISRYAKLLMDASHALTPHAHLFPAIQLQDE